MPLLEVLELTDGVDFTGAGTAGTKNTLVNSGVIAGGNGYAVDGDNGVDEITNSGTILELSGLGAINTHDGDDIVINTGVIPGKQRLQSFSATATIPITAPAAS